MNKLKNYFQKMLGFFMLIGTFRVLAIIFVENSKNYSYGTFEYFWIGITCFLSISLSVITFFDLFHFQKKYLFTEFLLKNIGLYVCVSSLLAPIFLTLEMPNQSFNKMILFMPVITTLFLGFFLYFNMFGLFKKLQKLLEGKLELFIKRWPFLK